MAARLPVLLATLAMAGAGAAQTAPGTCVPGLQMHTDQDRLAVALTWDAVPGAGAILVFRTVDGADEALHATLPGEATAFAEGGLGGGLYTYRVAADGPPPDDCVGDTVHLHGPQPPPPEPTCVHPVLAEALPSGGVRLTWEARAATSLDVLRGVGTAMNEPYAVLPGDATGFVDPDTVPGELYRYTVWADGVGHIPPCPPAVVAAIPDLPGPAFAVAALAGLAAWGLRRR